MRRPGHPPPHLGRPPAPRAPAVPPLRPRNHPPQSLVAFWRAEHRVRALGLGLANSGRRSPGSGAPLKTLGMGLPARWPARPGSRWGCRLSAPSSPGPGCAAPPKKVLTPRWGESRGLRPFIITSTTGAFTS